MTRPVEGGADAGAASLVAPAPRPAAADHGRTSRSVSASRVLGQRRDGIGDADLGDARPLDVRERPSRGATRQDAPPAAPAIAPPAPAVDAPAKPSGSRPVQLSLFPETPPVK